MKLFSIMRRGVNFAGIAAIAMFFVQCGDNSDDVSGISGSAAITGQVVIKSTATNGVGEIQFETLGYQQATGIHVELCELVDFETTVCGIDTVSSRKGVYSFGFQQAGTYIVKARINDYIEAEGDSSVILYDKSRVNGPTISFGPYPRYQGTLLTANRLPFPNPFTETVTLLINAGDIESGSTGDLKVRLFDVTGEEIMVLLDERDVTPGAQQIIWDGMNKSGIEMPAGMYFYVVTWYDNETNDFEGYVGNFMKR
ncbi:MAG: hypothetical protein D6675_04790 [Gemmatimonadetes bacterium]|nr:MAG: hypothetical protein D6675_04790 [Gemmatimonadota bacterium]